MSPVFDSIASAYDRWYDTPEGNAIFRAESECLLSLHHGPFDTWLDVGIGTGRFANAFGIPTGVDPSPDMLAIAAERGIETHLGKAECLPFTQGTFDGVVMALTLCFVGDAAQALLQCHRVTRSGGRLLLGIVPADSAWGHAYQEKAAHGHPVYSHAHFRTSTEVIALVQSAGYSLTNSASSLFWNPGEEPEPTPRIENGMAPQAGFLALLFLSS